MKKTDRSGVSILGIFEMIILAIGVIISIKATIKPLKYTNKYMWCFIFAVIGLIFIVILAKSLKKRYVCLLGACLIFIYIFIAGFGAIVCEVNASRLRKLSYYEGKNIYTYVNDLKYEWDGRSVTYDPSRLKPLDESLKFWVGEEAKTFDVYEKEQSDQLFAEVFSGDTGIFLILDPKNITVVNTYEETPPSLTEQYLADGRFLVMMPYYEMSDGTWKTDDNNYKYRLEITGRMGGAAKDSTFVYLSNIKDISFERAFMAAGFSSNMDDYFDKEDAVLVAIK